MVDILGMVCTNPQIDLLARLLDVASFRHDVIAHNVANVNTPGFQRQEVQFEDALAKALGGGNDQAALAIKPEVVSIEGGSTREDGNNVDIDLEMGRLNKNTLIYRVYTQILSVQLGQMRSAISGR